MVDYFTDEEEELILKSITIPHHKLIVLLMLDAGLRVSEVITLKWEDCNFRTKQMKVRSLKKRVENKETGRTIPFTNRLYECFIKQANEHKEKELKGWVFESDKTTSGHQERNTVNMFLNRLQEKVPSVSHMNPHKFRHTFATKLRTNQNSLEDVKDLLGHEDLKTTFIYSHQTDEIKRNAIQGLEGKKTWLQRLKDKFKKPEVLRKVHVNTNFVVGRTFELKELKKRVERNQNILLKGPAGVGKNHMLESFKFDKEILLIDDVKDIKKSLQAIIIHLSENDKSEVAKLLLNPTSEKNIETRLQKDSVMNLVEVIKNLTEAKEYVLKINNIDNLTPTTANVLDKLKDHFQIITTARVVQMKFLSIFSSFEQIEIKELSRRESYILIQRLLNTRIEDLEIVITKIFDTSTGNPQQIKELCEKINVESYVDLSLAEEICNNYLGRGMQEIDMSLILLLILGGFAILRYYGRESGEKDLQFIGGAIMIIMLFARYLFNGVKRKSI